MAARLSLHNKILRGVNVLVGVKALSHSIDAMINNLESSLNTARDPISLNSNSIFHRDVSCSRCFRSQQTRVQVQFHVTMWQGARYEVDLLVS